MGDVVALSKLEGVSISWKQGLHNSANNNNSEKHINNNANHSVEKERVAGKEWKREWERSNLPALEQGLGWGG